MRYALILFALTLILGGCSCPRTPYPEPHPLGPYESTTTLINAVENGEAHADVFVYALRKGPVEVKDLTPAAIANYMEALACEQMLNCIPAEYIGFPEVILSYEIVFEDAENIFNNWEEFKAYLEAAYGVHLI